MFSMYSAAAASPRHVALELDDEQRRALTSALFDAQLAVLRAITAEAGREPTKETRRNVVSYTSTFAHLRMASGQLLPGPGWFMPPFMGNPFAQDDDSEPEHI